MIKKDKNIGAAFCDAAAVISNAHRIGILCAMDAEAEDILWHMQGASYEDVADCRFYEGILERTPVVLLRSGVGKVNAARGAQMLIDRYAPTAIVNSGVAGALEEGLAFGDVVVASDFVQHDFDATALGYARGYLCTGENSRRPTLWQADPEMSALLLATAQAIESGKAEGVHRVISGRIASGDCFVGTPEDKARIREGFAAAAADMESAAIAQVAAAAGVPCAALRVISDLADGENLSDEQEKRAAAISAEIVRRFSARRA